MPVSGSRGANIPVNLYMIPVVFLTGKPGVAVLIEGNWDRTEDRPQGKMPGSDSLVLLDNQIEYVVRYTPDGILQYVNEPYCRALGRSREDLIGRPFKHLVSSDEAERIGQNRARLTVKYPAGMIEIKAIMANGEARWQRWWDRAIFDDRGQLTGYHSTGLDITDEVLVRTKLKKTQEMLEETIVTRTNDLREINRQLYEEMSRRENMEQQLLMTQFSMDNAADMVFWVNRNAKVNYANKAAVTGLGYTGEELADLAFGDIFALPPKSTWDEIWQSLTRAGTIHPRNIRSAERQVTDPCRSGNPVSRIPQHRFCLLFCPGHLGPDTDGTDPSSGKQKAQRPHEPHPPRYPEQGHGPAGIPCTGNKTGTGSGNTGVSPTAGVGRSGHPRRNYRHPGLQGPGMDPPEWLNIHNIVDSVAGRYAESPVAFDIDLPDLLVYAGPPDGEGVFPADRKRGHCDTATPVDPYLCGGERLTGRHFRRICRDRAYVPKTKSRSFCPAVLLWA